jgi:hypothetical protein
LPVKGGVTLHVVHATRKVVERAAVEGQSSSRRVSHRSGVCKYTRLGT